jgi:hypothetical protein
MENAMSKTFTSQTRTIGLLASTCLAAALATTLFAAPAQAGTWIDLPSFNCKDPAIIAQLEQMKAEHEKTLADEKQARARDIDDLGAAKEARAEDLRLIKAGASTWPAGADPFNDLARQDATIDKLERDIPVEDRQIQRTTDELSEIDAALTAINKMGPCETPQTTSLVPPGGHAILVGPPMVPPVLAGPPVVPVTDDPPGVDRNRGRSGFIDEPKKPQAEEPSTWERVKRWCRGLLECQTEADEKREHDEALRKAIEERHAQTRTEQSNAATTKTTTDHAVRTATVETHAQTTTAQTTTVHTATTHTVTPHVANVPTSAAVRGAAIRNVAAAHVSGLQTAGLGNRVTALGNMHPGGLGNVGAMRMGGFGGMHLGGMGGGMGAMHMGGMGGMHMGGMGGMHMGGMHMGGFARR